jgi:hypothetical protein
MASPFEPLLEFIWGMSAHLIGQIGEFVGWQ